MSERGDQLDCFQCGPPADSSPAGNVVLDTGMGQLTIELYWNEAPKVNT